MQRHPRQLLTAAVKYLGLIGLAAMIFVLIDFLVDVRPPGVQASYRFQVGDLELDSPVILRQANLSILVIRRSDDRLLQLKRSTNLQDPDSRRSHQPENANNPLRSIEPHLFVSYALGTHLGCPLEIVDNRIAETCSSAGYDFAGRAIAGAQQYQNLVVPDYTFSEDYSILTIRP